jgi:hypothetical protein
MIEPLCDSLAVGDGAHWIPIGRLAKSGIPERHEVLTDGHLCHGAHLAAIFGASVLKKV